MWIALFALAIAVAVFLSVTAFVMRDRDTIAIKSMRLLSRRASRKIAPAASPKFERAARRLSNMSEMMDRLGSDSKALGRRELDVRSVFRVCQNCSADDVCHDWLVRAPKSLGHAPAFCPNAKRFAHVGQA